jgi:hypothetical protein
MSENKISALTIEQVSKVKTSADFKRVALERNVAIPIIVMAWITPVEKTIIHEADNGHPIEWGTLLNFIVSGTEKVVDVSGYPTIVSGKNVKELLVEKINAADGKPVYPVSFKIKDGKHYKAASQGYITSDKNKGKHDLIKATMDHYKVDYSGEFFPLFVEKTYGKTTVDTKKPENWMAREQTIVELVFND